MGVVLRARGESHIQRNANGEVATEQTAKNTVGHHIKN